MDETVYFNRNMFRIHERGDQSILWLTGPTLNSEHLRTSIIEEARNVILLIFYVH